MLHGACRHGEPARAGGWRHGERGQRTAERQGAEARRKAARRRITVGEDKAYDCAEHVAHLRAMQVTPHVAQNDAETKTGRRRRSAIDGRTTRHVGYAMSQSRRAMIECIFGWGKQHGTMHKIPHRGTARVAGDFLLNLIGPTDHNQPAAQANATVLQVFQQTANRRTGSASQWCVQRSIAWAARQTCRSRSAARSPR